MTILAATPTPSTILNMPTSSVRPVIFIFAILLVLYISALLFGWFDTFPSFDIIIHLLGGVWVGALFLFLSRGFFPHDVYAHKTERLKLTSLAVAYAAFVGVLWEFFEYVIGPYFEGFAQASVRDTLGDLLMDMLGGFVYMAILLFVLPRFKSRDHIVLENK